VVIVDLGDEEALEEIVRANPLRGEEPIGHAARCLQKIICVVEHAVELNPAFQVLGNRVTVGQAAKVLEAYGEETWIRQEFLEELRDMEVNILVVDPEDPE
jgi:hypothetical protein